MNAKILADLTELASTSILHSKHAAILFSKKKIICMGINHRFYCGALINVINGKSNFIGENFCYRDLNLSIHAEEEVLNKFKKKKIKICKKLHLLVIRIDAFGNLTESKPCTNCINLMRLAGVKKVSYSTKYGNIITETIDTIIGRNSSGQLSIKDFYQKYGL